MDSRDQRKRVIFSLILGLALVHHLFAVLAAQGEERYSGGTTHEITDVDDPLVYIEGEGTIANFEASYQGFIFVSPDLPGATLNFGKDARANLISAGPGSSVNLYGGSVDFLVSVELDARVAIYGETFVVFDELKRTTKEYEPGTKLTVTRARVTAYDKWGAKLFNGRVSCVPGASVLLETKSKHVDVKIDVDPARHPSFIDLGADGTVPVAVFSNETFDATKVLPETVRFAGASVARGSGGKRMANAKDVDKDGKDDMLFHFQTKDIKLAKGLRVADLKLTGQLKGQAAPQSGGRADRKPISGSDRVFIQRSEKK